MRTARTVALTAAVAALLAPAPSGAEAPDEHASVQWGLEQVRARDAWPTSRGAGQLVAIVDTGVDLDHPDLAGQLAGGATFACGGAPAPCGDGDWRSGAGAGDPHGTLLAGIVAAATGNGIGIAGVAPDARLLAVKALTARDAGSDEAVAAAVRWSADAGADVVLVALSRPPGASAAVVDEAVAYARSAGALVVAPAGDDVHSPLCAAPAAADGVLCAVAVDRTSYPTVYTNGGVKPGLDSIAAFGGAGAWSVDVAGVTQVGGGAGCLDRAISTAPVVSEPEQGECTRRYGIPGYDFVHGTATAAAHVAGAAALVTAQGRSADEARSVLERSARFPYSDDRSFAFTPSWGHGVLDAGAAVAAP